MMKCPKCSGKVVARVDEQHLDATCCVNCGWCPTPTGIVDDLGGFNRGVQPRARMLGQR